MKIQSIRGVKDILPDEIWKWQYIESVAHNIFFISASSFNNLSAVAKAW